MRAWTIAALPLALVSLGCEAPSPRSEPPVSLPAFDPGAPQAGPGAGAVRVWAGTTVAIGRVAGGADGGAVLVPIAPTEQGYWSHRFAEITNVRDVRFVRPKRSAETPLRAAALRSAAEAEASLLLLYALNAVPGEPVEAVGVLIDVATGQSLISTRASADGPTTAELAGEKGDQRERDGQYQTARQFEAELTAMLADAARRSPGPGGATPHNWSVPPEQRWWLVKPD